MEKVIQVLEEKIVSAEKGIEKAKGWIESIENGNTLLGGKDHYINSVRQNEAYIVGLKASIREIKKEMESA
jgi:hypothetical protein